MSTLRVDTIQNASGTDSPINVPGTAKAWVNFNGTGTVAIRASYNVSSITDNGTGDYTVNFTTALVDANYSAVVAMQPTASNGGSDTFPINPSTSSVTVKHYEVNILRDSNYVNVAVFR
jgi:hypothetical protein